jgi:hypothetical protein
MPSYCLDELPVELLHHILRYLDTSTCLLSFRYVCKRFYTFISTLYDYKLDFRQLFKIDFHRLCYVIQPERVTSLTLSDDCRTCGQIELFLSLFHIEQFTGLHSLSLIQVQECHLKCFLRHVMSKCSLISLTIQIRDDHRPVWTDDMFDLILQTIRHLTTLRMLNLKIHDLNPARYPVPLSCSIEHLVLVGCLCQPCLTVLDCLPHLKSLTLNNFIMIDRSDLCRQHSPFSCSIRSLSIQGLSNTMHRISSFVSLFPCLIRLKLISLASIPDAYCDGSHWQTLIETRLPHLQTFEFFFENFIHRSTSCPDVRTIASSFQTCFWLQTKRWFVQCEYFQHSRLLNIYTLPICRTNYTYEYVDKSNVCSTWPNNGTHRPVTLDYVYDLHIKNVASLTTSTVNKYSLVLLTRDDVH